MDNTDSTLSNVSGQCFSVREVVLVATELEKEGYALYKYAERLAPSKRIKQILHSLGQDELDHIKVLNEEILPSFQKKEKTHWESDEVVAGYLKAMLEPDVFPDKKELEEQFKSLTSEIQAIDLGIEGEEKSIKFYKDFLKLAAGCIEGQAALEKIIDEEEKHREKLKELRKELSG